MATGHFYKTSDDAGAPALDNTAGSLIAVLDWALDTTGGTHWEKVFTGTNTAAYRATTGERFYFRIDDTFGGYARFLGYKTMSDVNTGTGPFPSGASFYGYLACPKSDNASAARYWVVGDSRFFMLVVHFDDTYAWAKSNLAFGEINPLDPLDGYTTIVLGGNTNITSATVNTWGGHGFMADFGAWNRNLTTNFHGDEAPVFFADSPDGLGGPAGCYPITSGTAPASLAPNIANFATLIMHPYWCPTAVSDADNADIEHTNRGRIPYLYNIGVNGFNGIVDEDTIEDGASDYILLTWSNTTSITSINSGLYVLRTTNDEPGRA